MNFTYNLIHGSGNPRALNLSLNTYTDISTYYRAGDNSSTNLESNIVAISKENLAKVSEAPPENYIINGK